MTTLASKLGLFNNNLDLSDVMRIGNVLSAYDPSGGNVSVATQALGEHENTVKDTWRNVGYRTNKKALSEEETRKRISAVKSARPYKNI